MNDKGKKVQVLFETAMKRNNITGEFEVALNAFQLWTEPNLEELIRKVPGVCEVTSKFSGYSSSYAIVIDPRYDVEFVKKEIEAEIICNIGEI